MLSPDIGHQHDINASVAAIFPSLWCGSPHHLLAQYKNKPIKSVYGLQTES